MKPKTAFFQKAFLILFGIFLSLFLIEAGLRLCGFTLTAIQEHRNRVSLKKGGAYRILCLGESTTQGQYPPFLAAALNRSGAKTLFTVIDEGRVGTNTGAILNQVESYLDKYHPDMVVAMMGINDPGTAHLPDEKPSASKVVLFFRSFKTYKLARLLFHISFKANTWALPTAGAQAPDTEQVAFPATGSNAEDTKPVSAGGGSARLSGGKNRKEEPRFNRANDTAYVKLGELYLEQEQFQQAEEQFKKAIQITPGDDRAYVGLGWSYMRQQGKVKRAEEQFKKAIRITPGNVWACDILGQLYLHQGQFQRAEEQFKKAIQITPGNPHAYNALGQLYLTQGRFQRAEEQFKKAIRTAPANDTAYYGLKFVRQYQGQLEQTEKSYYQEAARLNSAGYDTITARNYHALKTILDKRKIRLVCVQYPMRSVAPLKKIFAEQATGIIFVDNEKTFGEAIKKKGHKTYFLDMFGGDFGHCTPEGNKLLGENIAGVILREVFHN